MNPHIGSDFDEFLAEQGLAEEVSAALKRVIVWQITEAMKEQHISRTAADRTLDGYDADTVEME